MTTIALNTFYQRRAPWLKPLLVLITTGALLGFSTNLAKIAPTLGLSPLAFLAWSIIGATTILTALNTVKRQLPKVNKRSLEYFFVAALISVATPNLIFYVTIEHVGVAFVALAFALPPLFTYVGALFLKMERFQPRRALGAGLALAGVALLAALKLNGASAEAHWILLTLAAPIIIAAGNLYRTARWPDGAKPEELAPGMLMAASMILVAVSLLPGFDMAVPMENSQALGLIAIQAIAFAGQFLLYFLLQKLGGPVYFSLLGSVAAVVGIPFAVILLGESLPEGLFAGASLIALGIYLVTTGSMTKRRT